MRRGKDIREDEITDGQRGSATEIYGKIKWNNDHDVQILQVHIVKAQMKRFKGMTRGKEPKPKLRLSLHGQQERERDSDSDLGKKGKKA